MKTIELHRYQIHGSWTGWFECLKIHDGQWPYEHVTATLPEEKREIVSWDYERHTFYTTDFNSCAAHYPGGLMTESAARRLAARLNEVVEECRR